MFRAYRDLKSYGGEDARGDLVAAVSLLFLAVPQGIVYAMIAGLPPVTGLYAAAIPAIVGALFRSSRHVIIGPTNAISLLVGGTILAAGGTSPVELAVTLACAVGVIQLVAGIVGGARILNFISKPVLWGYITGAALLIGIGQLPKVTGTPGVHGDVRAQLEGWWSGLGDLNPWTTGMALGTMVTIVVLRRVNRRLPGFIVALACGTTVSVVFKLSDRGVLRVMDLSPVPTGLPPLTLPDLSLIPELVPVAIAVSFLGLIESNSVGRSIAEKSGQELDNGAEFVGLGLANITAGLTAGYPVSGSLSRSTFNYESGARTRLAGVYGGILMLGVLLFLGAALDYVPLAALGGLLIVIAWDLMDRARIKTALRGALGDKVAFVVTALGTCFLSLEQAIYLGIAVSFVSLARGFKRFSFSELERSVLEETDAGRAMSGLAPGEIRILDLRGTLFFGVEGPLRRCLCGLLEENPRGVVIHMSDASGMDVAISQALSAFVAAARGKGCSVFLSGVPREAFQMWERLGLLGELSEDNIRVGPVPWEQCALDVKERLCEAVHREFGAERSPSL